MHQYLIEKLKEGRREKNLKQSDVAKLTGIKPNTISNYENGVSEPDIDTYLQLCKLYELDYVGILEKAYDLKPIDGISVSPSEIIHIKKYRSLDGYGKRAVDGLLNIEYERMEDDNCMDIALPTLTKILYGSSPSAGTGNYLPDSIDESTIVIPDTPRNRKADYILQVQGNSMEPEYTDGEKVLVQKQDQVELNEIGIFIIDGEAFIKQLKEDRLHSLNPNYEDILFDENQNLHCMGKVIGKL